MYAYANTSVSKTCIHKGKGSPYNRPWGPKRRSWGIALPCREPRHEEGMVWLAPRPGRFNPGKETQYPLYRRPGGPQGRCGRLRKISPPSGFDPRNFQPVASRYTNWANPAHTRMHVGIYKYRSTFVYAHSILTIITNNRKGKKYQLMKP
jgi:hypothetical protein